MNIYLNFAITFSICLFCAATVQPETKMQPASAAAEAPDVDQRLRNIQAMLQVIYSQNQMMLEATFGPQTTGTSKQTVQKKHMAFMSGMRGRRSLQFWGVRGKRKKSSFDVADPSETELKRAGFFGSRG